MSLLKSITALAGLVWAASFAPSATALPISDTVTISGETTVTTTISEGEPAGGAIVELIQVFGVSPTGNSATYGSYTVLTEPDGTISDVFGVIPAAAPGIPSGPGPLTPAVNFNFAFFSDGEIGLTTVPAVFVNPLGGTPIFLPEGNGGPFNATNYLSLTLQGQGVTATVQSDAEPAPEPATLALLGIGLAGLGFSRRKKLT